MNILQTEWWTIGLPPEWWAEQEEDVVVIGDRDDVGCIEVSTLHKESGEFETAELEQLAGDNGEPGWDWQTTRLGEFSGCYTAYEEEACHVREWYAASGKVLLFITYSCDADNGGLDDAAVDEILQTLVLAS
jgi:hypothetical protein